MWTGVQLMACTTEESALTQFINKKPPRHRCSCRFELQRQDYLFTAALGQTVEHDSHAACCKRMYIWNPYYRPMQFTKSHPRRWCLWCGSNDERIAFVLAFTASTTTLSPQNVFVPSFFLIFKCSIQSLECSQDLYYMSIVFFLFVFLASLSLEKNKNIKWLRK